MILMLNKLSVLCLIAIGCVAFVAPPAGAADRLNLLMMAEDADSHSLPRHGQVVNRVLNAIAIQLQALGFAVYDESAVKLQQPGKQRVRRNHQELMAIGRSVRHPPIDVVVSFSVYGSLLDSGYSKQVQARVAAQMVQVNSGEILGSFEVSSPTSWSAPAHCDQACVPELIGRYSKILANDLGSVLAQKLAYLVHGSVSETDGADSFVTHYSLIFDNFSAEDVMAIEEYLVVFSGYHSHRPAYSSARRAELWYASSIKSAKLQRNLYKMLERLGLHARISYAGQTFTVEQTVMTARRFRPSEVW